MQVGLAVRRLRLAQGVTQTELGDVLGLAFQQVQKYERGANRISASMLVRIGVHLGAPAAYFFSGVDGQLHVDLDQSNLRTDARRPRPGPDLSRLNRRRRRLIQQLAAELLQISEGDPRPEPAVEEDGRRG